MSSLAGHNKKVINFLAKVPILAIFGSLGSSSKWIFSTCRQKLKKTFVNFLVEVVRNIVLSFGLSIFEKKRGVAVLHVDISQNP